MQHISLKQAGRLRQSGQLLTLTRDLSNSHTVLGSSGKVHVVRTDTSSQGQLQVLGLGQALWCQVAWVERRCDAAMHAHLSRQHEVW